MRRSLFDNHISASMEVSRAARQRIRSDGWQECGALLVCWRLAVGFRQPSFTCTPPTYSACTTVQANLEYMFKNFGFYFPDSQFLADPEGLLKYLVSWGPD